MGYQIADMVNGADGYNRAAATDGHRRHRFAQMVEKGEKMKTAARASALASHHVVEADGSNEDAATIERRA